MATTSDEKLWANSGDMHLMEPPDIVGSGPEQIDTLRKRNVIR